MSEKAELVLLTGATGYIGGRLLRLLSRSGFRLRCLARRPEYLRDRAPPGTDVVAGDVLARDSLLPALDGVDTAYYLIHSLGDARDFEAHERQGATNFAAAAAAAGVRRIVYLGGLGDEGADLSPHLRSRHEVGRLLAASGIPTVELRASVIIGSGSLSFEMIRALAERLPVMVTPRWVSVPAQPIAISDVLAYLLLAAQWADARGHEIIEIGGADVVSYGDILREYARQRGLRRLMLPVPFLTPRLSSLWLALVTPVYARVGRKLIEGIRNPTVVRDDRARRLFHLRPMGIREAIAMALRNEDRQFVETRWSDAMSAAGQPREWGGMHLGNRLVDSREADVRADPATVFRTVCRIGGNTGWYYGNWLWKLRGAMDVFLGGVGLRRQRRLPEHLVAGDTIDCWRVAAVDDDRLLLLTAEMRLPGRAWLEFELTPRGEGLTALRQTAIFDPKGLPGLLYWYSVWPFHLFVFPGMLKGIARTAEAD